MALKSVVLGVCLGSATTLGLSWLWRTWSAGKPKQSNDVVEEEEEDIALFFPCAGPAPCQSVFARRKCTRLNCESNHSPTHPLSLLVTSLGSATESIDLAMYTFSYPAFKNEIVAALHRGVRVRVLLDFEQLNAGGCTVADLMRDGVQVREGSRERYMHHKFAIIDGKVLINGSLNWTRAGVMGNFENAIISHRRSLVAPFQQEFDVMWHRFAP